MRGYAVDYKRRLIVLEEAYKIQLRLDLEALTTSELEALCGEAFTSYLKSLSTEALRAFATGSEAYAQQVIADWYAQQR